jgi:hypothetical protein
MAKSLLDGIDSGPTSSAKGASKSSGMNPDTIKLILALSLMLVAVGVLTWYYVLRDTAPDVPQMEPAELQAIQQQQEEMIRDAKARGHIEGGS